MDQKEFTDYVIPRLLEYFPQFMEYCVINPHDIVDIEYKSKSGNVELWITTQDEEITIGLTGLKRSLFDWHTHITTYDYDYINDDIAKAVETIENILGDKLQIINSSRLGYTLNGIEYCKENQELDELIEVTTWSKL